MSKNTEKLENYVGINKKLLDRRLELGFSMLEACIKLDISKRHLKLIEEGYIKVSKKLQPKFIKRYELDENFFSQDEYLYPTPIEDEPVDEKDLHKVHKFITSLKFKLIAGILTLGSIACIVSGMSLQPRSVNDRLSFYDNNVTSVRDYVEKNGHYEESGVSTYNTALLIGGGIYSYNDTGDLYNDGTTSYFNAAIHSFETDENVGYTFFTLQGQTPSMFFDNAFVHFEIRIEKGLIRCHLYEAESFTELMEDNYYHVVADYNPSNQTYTYRALERCFKIVYKGETIYNGSYVLTEDDIDYYFLMAEYECLCIDFEGAMNVFMANHFSMSFNTYIGSLKSGNQIANNYDSMVMTLIFVGLIAGTVFLASFVLSLIFSFNIDDKIESYMADNNAPIEPKNETTMVKDLPKNRFVAPPIPECVIRIICIIVMLLSSITLYALYRNTIALNISGIINNVEFSASISTLFTLSILLLFFIKLDVNQSQKDTFLKNFILFFCGLLFYFFLLILKFSVQNSQTYASNITSFIIDMLPGNIVWGILSFSLLSTFLFTNPVFATKQKEKTLIFRLCALIPLAYLVISSVYSIGHSAAGWNAPLAVSSLLFSKSFVLIIFACLYCLFVFIYKHYLEKKYGAKNVQIYHCGNRYYFIKNAIVSGILLGLGIVGLIIEKNWPSNPLGFNNSWLLFLCIPFILFYHPHLGKRKKLYDIGFIVVYGLSLLLGVLLILGDIGGAIATL